MLDMKEAKMIFDAGGLKNAEIKNLKLFDENEWIIFFARNIKDEIKQETYKSQRGKDTKGFKDLRSAVNIIKEIGFDRAEISGIQNIQK